MTKQPLHSDSPVQKWGEGDPEAARRFNEEQKRFVESGQVAEAAKAAAPDDANQAEEMERAEAAGRAKSRGEDPTVPGSNANPPAVRR